MKNLLVLTALTGILLPACNQAMPPVPPSNRTVVAPRGSSDRLKSWSSTTKQEADAVLGPLSNTERR